MKHSYIIHTSEQYWISSKVAFYIYDVYEINVIDYELLPCLHTRFMNSYIAFHSIRDISLNKPHLILPTKNKIKTLPMLLVGEKNVYIDLFLFTAYLLSSKTIIQDGSLSCIDIIFLRMKKTGWKRDSYNETRFWSSIIDSYDTFNLNRTKGEKNGMIC